MTGTVERATDTYIEVVGEAASGEQALALVPRLAPDIVLLDLVLPGMPGLDVVPRLKAAHPAVTVIVLTSCAGEESVLPAVRAGVAGYLLKDVSPAELADAVRAVHAGGASLDPGVAATVLRDVSAPRPADALTPREREVLRLIARGRSNRLIARDLASVPSRPPPAGPDDGVRLRGVSHAGREGRRAHALAGPQPPAGGRRQAVGMGRDPGVLPSQRHRPVEGPRPGTATDLAAAGWRLVLDARTAAPLRVVADRLGPEVPAVPGDVPDPEHRRQLADAIGDTLDLLVLNASTLGPPAAAAGRAPSRGPAPRAGDQRRRAARADPAAAAGAAGRGRAGGRGVQRRGGGGVPGLGGYAASKAALDRLAAVLGEEEPRLRVYAVDPGDLRTDMHQAALPGRGHLRPAGARVRLAGAAPASGRDLPGGRYTAADLFGVPA